MVGVQLVGVQRGDAAALVVEGDAEDALAGRARRRLARLLLVGGCNHTRYSVRYSSTKSSTKAVHGTNTSERTLHIVKAGTRF